VPSSVRSGVV